MSVVSYAHGLAARIPALAQDGVANNAYMLTAELEALVAEATAKLQKDIDDFAEIHIRLLEREQRELMSTVVQPWLADMSWKCQSILFSGLRGPDQEYLVNIKQVSKWMRSVTQHNADPSKPYMNDIELPKVAALYKELEHCPCHFVHHFLDALAVIAYGHPDRAVAEYAARVHYHCAEELFHFIPEFPSIFLLRHRDKPNGADDYKTLWANHEQEAKQRFMDAALSRFTVPNGEPSPSNPCNEVNLHERNPIQTPCDPGPASGAGANVPDDREPDGRNTCEAD